MTDSPGRKQFVDYKNTFIFWFFDRYGLPLLLLFGVAYTGYRFALWIEPRADQLIDTHIDIVHTAKKLGAESLEVQKENQETNKRTTEILAAMADNTKPLAGINGEHMLMTKEIRDDVRDMSSDVRDIHRAVVPRSDIDDRKHRPHTLSIPSPSPTQTAKPK